MPGDAQVDRGRARGDAAGGVRLLGDGPGAHRLPAPQLDDLAVERGGEADVLAVQRHGQLLLAEVERRDVLVAVGPIGRPQHERVLTEHLPVPVRVGVRGEDVGIAQQRDGRRIGGGQITAHHERRPGDHPQRQERDLLVGREQRVAGLAALSTDPDPPQGEHVAVGPPRGAGVRGPAGEAREVRLDVLPPVPQVVADPPHRGVLAQMVEAGQGQVPAGREAQPHRPAAAGDRPGERLDLRRLIRPEHVVDLEEVHAPGGVQREHRVVVGAGPRHRVVDADHVRVPLAAVRGIGDVGGAQVRAQHRSVRRESPAGDPPHHMDAQAQAQSMDLLRERRESCPVGGAREPARIGQQSPVLVHHQRRGVVVAVGAGRGVGPVDVDHHRVPAEGKQVLGEELRIGEHLRLGDGGAEAVPGVPAHRRARVLGTGKGGVLGRHGEGSSDRRGRVGRQGRPRGGSGPQQPVHVLVAEHALGI